MLVIEFKDGLAMAGDNHSEEVSGTYFLIVKLPDRRVRVG